MKIEAGKYVAATYELYVGEPDERELMDKGTEENPLRFICGMGQMLEPFEERLLGKEQGEGFDVVIPVEDAYGPYDDDQILELPKNMFEVEGFFDADTVYPGNVVPLMDSNGNRLNGSVLEVKEDIVLVDFNHPLAGETLHFIGKIIEVRDPKPEELSPSCGGCGGSCDQDECNSGGCGGCGCE